MALKIFEKFSPRANPADADYPFGSIKNESVPGAKDGTPLDASWGNDMLGFTDALLDEAGITPNGLPDTVQSSQRLEALKVIINMPDLDSALDIPTLAGKVFDGQFVKWLGYYEPFDGGGNTGIVKTGAHTEDGGSIFSIDANTYIKADLNANGVVYFEQFGARNTNDNPTFDSIDAMYAAAEFSSKLEFKLARTYGISRKFTYPRSGITIKGVTSAPFGSTTSLRPVDDTFPDDCLVDLNENGSESGTEGGQFNRLDDIRVFGGMSDWTDGDDPLAGLVGVKFKKTRDTCGMHNVSFRNCGVPFEGEGYIHWLSKIYVFQCYEGPSLISTNSSSIDTYVIQTCAKNWGYLKNCAVHNATIQQGTEKQDLDDDVGVTCEGLVNFTGYFYSEGGNAQIYVGDNSQVSVENYHMGFTILSTAGFGHHNIRVGSGSEIVVSGGRSSGVKSFLVGGSPNSAKNIHLDINEYDGRVVNSATNEELPTCENFYIKRSYGIISRTNDFNEISLNQYNIGTTTVTLWDQFDAGNANPFGGIIKVQVGGSDTYDMYEIDFTDSPLQAEQVNIRTIFRNTGGSGDNNIILSYSGGVLTAQGRKPDQRLTVRVSGYGELYPKPVS